MDCAYADRFYAKTLLWNMIHYREIETMRSATKNKQLREMPVNVHKTYTLLQLNT
jgi:hypothetical protein